MTTVKLIDVKIEGNSIFDGFELTATPEELIQTLTAMKNEELEDVIRIFPESQNVIFHFYRCLIAQVESFAVSSEPTRFMTSIKGNIYLTDMSLNVEDETEKGAEEAPESLSELSALDNWTDKARQVIGTALNSVEEHIEQQEEDFAPASVRALRKDLYTAVHNAKNLQLNAYRNMKTYLENIVFMLTDALEDNSFNNVLPEEERQALEEQLEDTKQQLNTISVKIQELDS